jgi:hypothetical protein
MISRTLTHRNSRNVPYRNKKAGRVILSHRMLRTAAKAGKPTRTKPEQAVISWRERHAFACRGFRQISHAHLHPDDGKPKPTGHDIGQNRQDDPAVGQRVADVPGQPDNGERLSDNGGRREQETGDNHLPAVAERARARLAATHISAVNLIEERD